MDIRCVIVYLLLSEILITNYLQMKVTAIIPDELVKEAQSLSKAKNITEAMIIALNSYVSLEKLKAMGNMINKSPLKFEYTAQEIRELNRS